MTIDERLILLMKPDKRHTVEGLATMLVEDHSDVVFALERLKRLGFVRERSDLCFALTTPGTRLREMIISRSS